MRLTVRQIAMLAFGALVVLAGLWWWAGGPGGGPGSGADASAQSKSSSSGPSGAGGSGPGGSRAGGSRSVPVVTRPVERGVTGDRLRAIGDGEAAASVDVSPDASGRVVALPVRSGARVVTGELLIQLDDEAETIARDLAAQGLADAERARDRQASLRRSEAGVQADFDAAENAVARAELELQEAQLALDRRAVRAPLDGTVGLIAIDVGDRVDDSDTLVTIDDRSTLHVVFRVPERFASLVQIGQRLDARALALQGRPFDGEITAMGSRIERDSRTLVVQASVDNSEDLLRPGMSFSVELRFDGEALPSVDPLAIQWSSTGAYVWRVQEDKAVRVPVEIVQREPDTVLVNGELEPGHEVVIEGVLSLRDGMSVERLDRSSTPAGDVERSSAETRDTDAAGVDRVDQ